MPTINPEGIYTVKAIVELKLIVNPFSNKTNADYIRLLIRSGILEANDVSLRREGKGSPRYVITGDQIIACNQKLAAGVR